jgi:hypothetical protein
MSTEGESRPAPSEPPERRTASSRPAPRGSYPSNPSVPSIPSITAPIVTEKPLSDPPIERPPMSMSAIANDSYPPPPSSRPATPIMPPVLASDILRDEVAPIAPAQKAIVLWSILFSLAFGTAAVFSWIGIIPRSVLLGAAVTAIAAAIAALLPVPYTIRALLAAGAGWIPLAMGVRGNGPLAAMHSRGDLIDIATLAALTFLPGVLLFRSRYRAFLIARILLGVALVLALPAEVGFAMAALDQAVPLLTRIADGVVFVGVLGACFGFMGAETTGFGAFWGALIVTTHAAGIAARGLPNATDPISTWITGQRLGFFAAGFGEWLAATLAAHAIFQLLAALLAKQARQVDVHRIVGPSAETASAPDRLGEDDRPESLGDDG